MFSQVLIAIIVLAKFGLPLLFAKFPFAAIWSNYFLDVVDGDALQYLGLDDYWYQTIDKSADYFSYILMVVTAWRWPIRKTVLGLFIYRSLGQLLFFVTRNELWFMVFQNFLEPLMMVYTLLIFVKKGKIEEADRTYRKFFILIWVIILAYKLWNEWYLHFANIDLSLLIFGINGNQ